MSTSTVSIMAKPTARRRPVVATEKKTTRIELLAVNDAAAPQPSPKGAAGGDDLAAGNGKDLSHHSSRGERPSRDLELQVKTSLGNDNNSAPLRHARKVLPHRPEQHRWVTVFRVFAKNFILLVVLAGLVQVIRRLAEKPRDSVAGTETGFSELEGRIEEVEAFMKTTAKMIQVQVEVVDRKIENEIGGLRRETKSELKRLETKSEGLERSLGELKEVEWLSEEFDRIYEDLKNSRRKERGDGRGNLDEIRAYAREMIEREIEKHAADGLGRVDYALASAGAMVVKHSAAYSVGKTSNWFSLGGRNAVHADKMLRPSLGEPGQCFALSSGSGFVQIRLRTAIVPEAVTLEHVAKSVAYDRFSAPKDCRVSGWLQGQNPVESVDTEKMFLLAEFTYDLEKSNAQTFNVLNSESSGIVDTVRLDFTSNHGSPSHTCIYRFRVHGREPDSLSTKAM
ncbi:SUN domain-containing protein 1-like [Juglans microcarpa x Juglans regia]|uniref:SUN domain-containing protein 1-like n=1 Tax=Juglans microcarpa x Juglans regia TaxID=2249226 RepID=UPI001B7F4EBE|nr:SUN domain-containing protein 1-like [Juglans microcarpa x Juglans regia]